MNDFFLRPRALMLAAVLTGCATQPPEPQTAPLIPEHWQNSMASTTTVSADTNGDWWTRFGSGELNRLIEQAMQANFDLRAAVQRIEQARARLSSSRATLFPQLDASYSASGTRRWPDDTESTQTDSDRFGLSASYEVDLWGKLRAGADAAEAALAGSGFSYRALALSLQAQVASSYFQYLAASDRLRFAEESLSNAEQLLTLFELQFREGGASRLELVQQQTSVISQKAQINNLRNSRQQIAYALDLLLGQKPGSLELSGRSLMDVELPAIAAGQPADLLQRRPDVLQAEAALVAAHASVDAARAAFFPSLRITAGASASQLFIGNPVTQAASLAASLAAPVFDAGRNRSDYRRALAAQEEVLLNYYQTLLTAVNDVQKSLVNVDRFSTNLELQHRRLALSQESYTLAELLYREGSTDFITLLDAERSLISAQDVYVQSVLQRHLEAATLYKALGGSWDTSKTPQL
jgi:multidrug efflux system outer membrane protein